MAGLKQLPPLTCSSPARSQAAERHIRIQMPGKAGETMRVPLSSNKSPFPHEHGMDDSSGISDVYDHLLPLPLPAAETAKALVGGDLP